jgi:hypothetical protein
MGKTRGTISLAVSGGAALWCLSGRSFVPGPVRPVVPVAVVAAGAAPALADPIGDAAKKLADGAYPFLKEVKWDSTTALIKPGSGSAGDYAKAVGKAIDMGAAMDSKLLKAGVEAHHKAIGSLSSSNMVASKADFEAISAALGRMIASVPESKTMDVYNAFGNLVSPEVPAYLMSTVDEGDAKKAYSALMDFANVVKANPISASVPATPDAGKYVAIDGAAAKLAKAAYPFVQGVDWSSDLYSKPLPGASPLAVTKAIDKALVMGAAMDGKLLQEAAQAHVKAINGMDSKLVASEADFTGVVAGLGKVIASVPASKTMDVYNAFGKIVDGSVPSKLYSTVNPGDAVKAYDALISFTNTVKAVQR